MEHKLSHCTFNFFKKSRMHSILLKVFFLSIFLISTVGNDIFAQIDLSISPNGPIITSASSVDVEATFSTDVEGYVLDSYQFALKRNGNNYDLKTGTAIGNNLKIKYTLEESGNYEFVGLIFFKVYDAYGTYIHTSDRTVSKFIDVTLNYVETAPITPINLAANNITTSECTLSWTPSPSATGYYIYENGSYLRATTSSQIVMDDLNPNTNYTYQVSAYNDVGESLLSNAISVTTLPLPPSLPTNLTVTNIKATECTLSWNESSGIVEGYRIYQNGTQVKTTTSTSLTIDDLSQGTNYVFEVSAYNSGGESVKSEEVSVTTGTLPMAPTNFNYHNLTNKEVLLTWTASLGIVSGYKIHQHLPTKKVFTTTSNSYIINELTSGILYVFFVTAYNDYGETLKSAYVAFAPPPPLSAPTNLTIDNITSNECTLSWDEAAGSVSHYNIYRNNIKVKTVLDTSTTISGLTPDTAYSFSVTAYNSSEGESEKSNIVMINTPSLNTPSPPVNLTASNISSTSCTLSWIKPSGIVTRYYVYKNGVKVRSLSNTSVFINDLDPETSYSFEVSAYNDTGESVLSNTIIVNTPAITIPSMPTNLRITDRRYKDCTLEWDASSGVVTGYYVYLMVGSNVISKSAASGTDYSFTGLGGTFNFAVSAYNIKGESAKSNIVSFSSGGSSSNSDATIFMYADKSINPANYSGNINIYPNPVRDELFVEGVIGSNVILSDLRGKIIQHVNEINGRIDVSHLEPGTYIIQIETKEQKIIKRIVKQ